MADKNFYINFDRSTRVNADRSPDTTQVTLAYQEVPNWNLNFIDEATGAKVDLSHISAWASAVDDDFDPLTEPWVRVLNDDIDSTDSANGVISIPVDSNTSTFLAGIGTEEYKTVYFELRGYDASSVMQVYVRFEILAKNIIDASGGTPPDPVGDYWSKTESDSRFWQQDMTVYSAVVTPVGTDLLPLRQGTTSNSISLTQISAFMSTITATPNSGQFTLGVDDTDPLNPIITISSI